MYIIYKIEFLIANIFDRYYNESIEKSKICQPEFLANENNYILNGTKLESNSYLFIAYLLIGFWVTFIISAMLEELFSTKFSQLSYTKIGLAVAAVIFSAGIAFLSKDKFDKQNFCLMNFNDSFCDFDQISCFRTSKMPLKSINFTFGQYIKSESKNFTQKGTEFLIYKNNFDFLTIIY